MLGKMLSASGQHAEACEHLGAAAQRAPSLCAQHLQLQYAWACWHCGRYADAEALYWQVLDDDVLCWQALIDRSRMHLQREAWAQALCDLAQVAAMGKADADVCNDLGVAHFELGDQDQAAGFFSEALADNPNHAAALANRANTLKEQGQLRAAEEDYTRSIELDPTNVKAFANRGALLAKQGLTVRAHRDYERALALDPVNRALHDELEALAEKLKEAGVTSDLAGKKAAGGAERQRAVSNAVGTTETTSL